MFHFLIFFVKKILKQKHGDVNLHLMIVLARFHSIPMFGRKVITVNTFGSLIDVFSEHEKWHLPGSHSQPFNCYRAPYHVLKRLYKLGNRGKTKKSPNTSLRGE